MSIAAPAETEGGHGMEMGTKVARSLQAAFVLALIGVSLSPSLDAAAAQDRRAAARAGTGAGHRAPAASDPRPIDADQDSRDDTETAENARDGGHAGQGAQQNPPKRHLHECPETPRTDPRWQEKKPLTGPNCPENY